MLKPAVISKLQEITGKAAVLTAKEDLAVYSFDATGIWSHLPDVVVLPTTSEQISRIMKLANEEKIPVTARGGGTGLAGSAVPVKGGIVLVTTRLNKILEVNKANLSIVVESGLVLQEMNVELAKLGLFFPPDPQSFNGCTIGGVVAMNSGGPACVKYGVVKQYVLGLEVVLATGEIVKLGGTTSKNRQGYELAILFAGSEGTLGIITKVTLRLLPAPQARKSMIAVFNDVTVAGEAVSAIIASGTIPSKIEMLDNWFLQRIEKLTPMGLPVDADAMLIIQIDGTVETIESDARRIFDILKKSGAKDARLAKDDAESAQFWTARSGGMAAVSSAARVNLSEDVTVPRNKIPDYIKGIREIAKKHDLTIVLSGHAGDGNIHPSILTDDRDKVHFARAHKAMDEIVDMALALGGVISGEHGIGISKQRYFKKAVDPVAIEIMRKIKGALDPNNILNPDKIWEN
ncbi:MAG: FAD-linked oxidase C-terminal domain-containing protein [Dehalococcoidales bacterium]|nr:FAD-linked oxidase C-terminal domain-containing protein [Dehalococcoidales bacterium]